MSPLSAVQRTPVHIISGFLGVGKTTLLQRELARRAGQDGQAGERCAVLVNDFGEARIDRLLLGGGDARALAGWSLPVFPLKGGAIVARGVTAGPAVARVLQSVEARWVAEGFPDPARIDALLTEELARIAP